MEKTNNINAASDNKINGQKIGIASLNIHEYKLQTSKYDIHYKLYNWLAMDKEIYLEYAKFDALTDKLLFLEHLLNQHIVAFFRNLEIQLEEKIIAKITVFKREEWLEYEPKNQLPIFNISLKVNACIPDETCIGKEPLKGFGRIVMIQNPL